MYTLLPFLRYSPAISPKRPNITTLCHSVFSRVSPVALSRQLSLVASDRLATALPPWVWRISGSLPRLPIKMTLLMPRAMLACLSWWVKVQKV